MLCVAGATGDEPRAENEYTAAERHGRSACQVARLQLRCLYRIQADGRHQARSACSKDVYGAYYLLLYGWWSTYIRPRAWRSLFYRQSLRGFDLLRELRVVAVSEPR